MPTLPRRVRTAASVIALLLCSTSLVHPQDSDPPLVTDTAPTTDTAQTDGDAAANDASQGEQPATGDEADTSGASNEVSAEAVQVEAKASIEAFAATIVEAAGTGQDRSPGAIANAERMAAEAGRALLNTGNILGLQSFTDAFYAELYPDSNGAQENDIVWARLGETDRFLTMSSALQFLRIRAGLLGYVHDLNTPPSDLTSPAELLTERRKVLAQIQDQVALAQDSLFDRRRSVGADRYRQISGALHVAAAEVHMHTGDAGYRLYAASILTELTSGAAPNNSSASYGAARQALFEALLLSPDNVRAKFLAGEIEDRLEWLRSGRAFGGGRFFEVEPVMGQFDAAEWTPLARLRTIRARLDALDQVNTNQSQKDLEKFIADFTTRLQQNSERRQNQIAQLSREIADLQFRIQQTRLGASQALEDNAQIIRDRLARSETTRVNFEERSAALDSEIGAKADELRRALDALAEVTSQGDLFDPGKFKAFATTAEQVMDDTKALVDDIAAFNVKSLKDRAETLKSSFARSEEAAGRTVDIIEFEIERLKKVQKSVESAIESVERAVELASSEYLEAVAQANIDGLRSEIDILQTEITEIDFNIAEEVDQFTNKIYDLTLGKFEREKARVQAKIDETKAKIASATELIELVQTQKQRAEEAIAAAQLAVEAAAAIPSGIIAGTASGTFNQKPQALMKVQELGLKIIDTAQKVELDIRKAKGIIGDLRNLVDEYRAAFESIDEEKLRAQFDKGIADAKAAGKELEADLTAKMKAAEAQIAEALKASGARIEARFKQTTAKFAAEKAEFEAEIEAIEAEIKAFEARIYAEQRRARALVDEIAVIRGDLGRLTLEKKGIEEAMARAETKANLDVSELRAAAALEAEQFDEITQPLVRRIAMLREIADTLAAGGEAHNLDLPINQLTARSLGPSADAIARERLALMDEANQLLFQYANWLFLMTRDARALDWAISAQSKFELNLAMTRLKPLYDTLRRTTGLSTPRYFVVRIPKDVLHDALAQRAPTERDTLSFTVNPALAPLAEKDPTLRRPGTVESIGEQTVSVYEPLSVFLQDSALSGLPDFPSDTVSESAPRVPLKGQSEIVFAPFVESENGAHHLLWDAWVVPNWTDKEPAELSMVGLKPVGPTFYSLGTQVRGHPVLRSRLSNYTATASSYEQLHAQHDLAMRFLTSGSQSSLIDGTLPGMNYRSLLGRGLGNTWELTAPKGWSDLDDKSATLSELESVDIVFGYLIAPERVPGSTSGPRDLVARLRAEQREGIEPDPAKRVCASLKTQWLCDLRDLQRQEVRAVRARERFDKAKPTEISAGGQRGDFRNTYDFANSPAATEMRVSMLSEMARSMPRGAELMALDALQRPEMPVLNYWMEQSDETHPVRHAFVESFCLEGAVEAMANKWSCSTRTMPEPPSFAQLTHEIVRDEMLGWPETQAAPVGPLELIRTWRSVERLFGSVDSSGQINTPDDADGAAQGETLLSETRQAERVLNLVSGQMGQLNDHIAGPILLARHWVSAYETARQQLDFVEQFRRALSDMSDVNNAAHSDAVDTVSNLQGDLRTKLIQLHCAEAWFVAAQAAGLDQGDPREMAASVAARMIDALEPTLDDLVQAETPAPMTLRSFPFPECAGIFIEAYRRMQVQ